MLCQPRNECADYEYCNRNYDALRAAIESLTVGVDLVCIFGVHVYSFLFLEYITFI